MYTCAHERGGTLHPRTTILLACFLICLHANIHPSIHPSIHIAAHSHSYLLHLRPKVDARISHIRRIHIFPIFYNFPSSRVCSNNSSNKNTFEAVKYYEKRRLTRASNIKYLTHSLGSVYGSDMYYAHVQPAMYARKFFFLRKI